MVRITKFFIFIIIFVALLSGASSTIVQAQTPPSGYTGCQGILITDQCNWDEYEPSYCYGSTGSGDTERVYTQESCGSCFIQHPDLPSGQGVCILHKDTTFIGPAPDNAPPIGPTETHCPVCPDGYDFDWIMYDCNPVSGTVSAPHTEIIRWDDCTQTGGSCETGVSGSGCKEPVGGGCLAIGPTDEVLSSDCSGERSFTCDVNGTTHCCETQGQCVAAGGQQQRCIRATDLTPGTGPTSCAELYPDTFPQLCRTEDWENVVTLVEGNYCCYSQDACDDLGGFDRGIVNDRPVGEYDVCVSNLQHNGGALDNCNTCYSNDGIWTAIGCIDRDPRSTVEKVITIGIGIIGGIFLLRVLAAAFMLTTSQGDVKKTSEAKEMITEAVAGIIFVIFSVSILQFVGSDILKIPGFGS
jgi:hypothetical protein